ncbi:cyclic-di-AMP receptor [Coprothermobacter platensis]|uniref:cyclic-di-AMP receptor n=1 Tax=Coprothermobacter platensis TaxID=108819 RepID=UPI0003738DDA|nr:cyclic-di-AMP receptor [Coprothermobacter platensis]
MKLFITILQEEDYRPLAERLTEKGIYHTRLAGEGGFLGGRKVVLLSAVEDEEADTLLGLIKESCSEREETILAEAPSGFIGMSIPIPMKVHTGGAVVMILPLEKILKV